MDARVKLRPGARLVFEREGQLVEGSMVRSLGEVKSPLFPREVTVGDPAGIASLSSAGKNGRDSRGAAAVYLARSACCPVTNRRGGANGTIGGGFDVDFHGRWVSVLRGELALCDIA